jgi:Zn finger protein HypA/HybF involved in hydrogenase expression
MYKKIRIDAYNCRCERCNHKWIAYEKPPIACAKCKTRSWNIKPKNKKKK